MVTMRRAYFTELAAPRSDAEASVPTPIHHGRYSLRGDTLTGPHCAGRDGLSKLPACDHLAFGR